MHSWYELVSACSDEEEVAFLHDVKLLQKVGQGSSGAVYLGLWQGNQTVAVKLIVNNLEKELDLRTVKVRISGDTHGPHQPIIA
jgi:hypothetical protein